ncbi:MAG: CoA transferase [Betaproteobacteria bacterium]
MVEQALTGIRVVDLTTSFGYATKLFADLGATVVLVEPPGGSPARARPPLAGGDSQWFAYRNCGKHGIVLNADRPADCAELGRLVAGADIVFDDRLQSFWLPRGLSWEAMRAANPDLVWCAITPFGQTGPAAGAEGCDLVAMASGGMAWLAGYEDTGPYVGDCGLATTSAAQYAAVTAMIAMLGRRNAGGGQFVDVSMQEVMALGTETAPQFLAMKNIMRRRLGERARQAGIGVYPCADGHVFLYAAESGVGRGWNLLAQWICEAGVPGAAELRDPRWQDNAFKARLEQRTRFDELWRAFAATRDRQWLFHEGQRRRIAISPLNAAADVLADAHLNARQFFDARGWPGAPYQLTATPWQAQRTIGAPNADADFVRAEAQRRRAPAPALPAAGVSALPLAGLRVIDLTWVGAGPFSTKLLADFGAEVWKIESTTRPDQLRRAEPMAAAGGLDASGYFANRNTNKKSVTLDLKHPEDLARVRELLATADIVANSFSPGVMDRLGLSWAEVARINPRAIYLGMPFAGDEGLYRDYLGYGINIATLVGMFGRQALAGRLPVGTGTNFPDHLPNPLHACFAVLAALAWRLSSHQGQRITVAQVESTLAACPDAVLEVAATGHESPSPAYVEPWRAPHGIFRCLGEDRWCALSVADDATFARLCALLGRPDLAPSARFGERALVDTLVGTWLAQCNAEDAVAALRDTGVAAAIVATPDDLLHRDAQLAARGFWQHLEHPVMGRGVYHGVAARFSLTPTRYRTGAPLLGQHNDELARLQDGVLLRD